MKPDKGSFLPIMCNFCPKFLPIVCKKLAKRFKMRERGLVAVFFALFFVVVVISLICNAYATSFLLYTVVVSW